MLEEAALLFEVADKVEEVLTDLMIRKGFGLPGTRPTGGGDDGPAG
jgi:hypothetical protein